MSAKSSTGRNTNNSRWAALEPSHDDDDMSSSNSIFDPTKRPRTPKDRYSPEARRSTKFCSLAVDVAQRNADLNADGSGPSSSGLSSNPLDSERRESRRRDDSTRRKPFQMTEDVKRRTPATGHRRKKRTPSPIDSLDETAMDSDDEWAELPIITDRPDFKITPKMLEQFKSIEARVNSRVNLAPAVYADIYAKSDKTGEPARVPQKIHMGSYVMKTWYGSPFPQEYVNVDTLIICEFCLFYARSDPVMQNHAKKCPARAPPGVEIYRKGKVSVFEVDGKREKAYCQTVCLIARLYLDSKTVFYDTDPFHFYIVTVNDDIGCHFAGYFSKEKYEPDKNNLACIMTLPSYQEKGFGRFLIDVSYALSRREGWLGGPEQPLSDLGRIAYGTYWRNAICRTLKQNFRRIEGPEANGFSILDISMATGIHPGEVTEVLDAFRWFNVVNVDEFGIGSIEWDIDWGMVNTLVEKAERDDEEKGRVVFDESFLDWQPRKITPAMDGFCEPSAQDIADDEERKKNVLKTPITESMAQSTPASTSSLPCGSVKKDLRSRGAHRSTATRNLQNELAKKVVLPEWAHAPLVDSEEDEERKKKRRRRRGRCAESTSDRHREDTPEDEGPFKPIGRRSRTSRAQEDPAPSTDRRTGKGAGKGAGKGRPRHRKHQRDSDEKMTTSEEEEDDVPFEVVKGKKGRRGRKKSVAGKQFPPGFGRKKEEKKTDSDEEDDRKKPGPSGGAILEKAVESLEDVGKEEEDVRMDDPEEEVALDHYGDHDAGDMANYQIRTPESYHSASSTPAPAITEHLHTYDHHQIEENDAAPPLLVSEVANLSVTEPEPIAEASSSSQLAPIAPNLNEFSDDEAPPRLSPQYEKAQEEDNEKAPEMMQMEPTPSTSSMNGISMSQYQMGGASTSMHMTPLMTSTPHNQFSQPNSHQQTTPGSGGVPSCGVPPVYNHSTPEQQQQFMSPQMAGMPASVSSVHSVHNNNSMEMVGGPASLQHTPQQNTGHQQQPPPPYDMGHNMMPPDNMGNNVVPNHEQQNLMMQQHNFNSPPAQPLPPTQPPPTMAAPAPARTNGRRQSAAENAATNKRRTNRNATTAPTPQVNPMGHMAMPGMGMNMQYPFYPGYAYPPMWDPSLYYQNYYNQIPGAPDPRWANWGAQGAQQNGGQMDGAVPQFPPQNPWYNYQNNMR